MIYFLYYSYVPDTAPIIRALSYWKSIEKIQTNVKVVFLMPDDNYSRVKYKFKFVQFKYYWDNYYLSNRCFRFLSYYLYQFLFLRRLNKGDKVYVYGLEKTSCKIIKKTGVDLYIESTECPEVYRHLHPIHHLKISSFFDTCIRAKGLIVISSALKEYYINKGIDEKKIHIVNMTVDIERFENLKKSPSSEKYIAYCGNISNNKDGVDILIKAFAIVVRKYPKEKLFIIGNIPSNEESLENIKLIKELGIENNVIFTGRIAAELMPQILKDAQILALARPDNVQAKYGFPTKLGEYLMTSNPVVVTAVGDIPKYLHNKINGLLSPPNDEKAFADTIIWALEHPIESKVIGLKGKELAESSFNSFKETQKLLEIIKGNSMCQK